MKKAIIILLLICLSAYFSTAALAFDGSEANAAVSAVNGMEGFYEASVISRMMGRAGAATASGAKGIVFEIMYADKQNLLQEIWKGNRVILSESSTNPLADLVVKDKGGSIVKLIQCKDGTSASQIYKVITDCASGKYQNAELVGTDEFAELFNTKAAGIEDVTNAKPSGISTETTAKIANKSLNILPTTSEVISNSLKASGVTMLITVPISVAESLLRGDDFYEATGNLMVDLGRNGLSASLGPIASAGATALLVAVEASGTGVVAGATVVGILIPVGANYVLCKLCDKYDVEATVAEAARTLGANIQSVAVGVISEIEELDLPGKAEAVVDFAKGKAVEAGNAVASGYNIAADWVKDTAINAGALITGLFK